MVNPVTHPFTNDKELLPNIAVILGLTLAVFAQTLFFDFINYDDTQLIVYNDALKQPFDWNFLTWAFTTFHGANWNPLLWLSFRLDIALLGFSPFSFHLTNLVLHTANTLLLYALIQQLSHFSQRKLPSLLIALIFAIHPQHVEVVAWISARKDLLSTFFGFLAILGYLDFCRGRKISLGISLLFYLLSLLAKPMFITLPVLLLLLDFWPLNRIQKEKRFPDLIKQILLKLWYLPLALLFSFFAVKSHTDMGSVSTISFDIVLGNTIVAVTQYIQQFLLPVGLSVYYPYQTNGISPFVVIAFTGLALTSVYAIIKKDSYPYLLVGWFWFLVALAPVSGIIQFGVHGMADRFTYLPSIGLSIILALLLKQLLQHKTQIYRLLTTGLLIIWTPLAWFQTQKWENTYVLFSDALTTVGEHSFILTTLATEHGNSGNIEAAIKLNLKALAAQNKEPYAILREKWRIRQNIAAYYFQIKNYQAALKYVDQALELQSKNPLSLSLRNAILSQAPPKSSP